LPDEVDAKGIVLNSGIAELRDDGIFSYILCLLGRQKRKVRFLWTHGGHITSHGEHHKKLSY
jgi:hypothetical protein